jgi:hypothetical protein
MQHQVRQLPSVVGERAFTFASDRNGTFHFFTVLKILLLCCRLALQW